MAKAFVFQRRCNHSSLEVTSFFLLLFLPTITVPLELKRHVLAPARRNPDYGSWEVEYGSRGSTRM